MLIHAIVIAQDGFTTIATLGILYTLHKNPANERRHRPSYIRLWLISYLMLTVTVAFLLDSNRELEHFWAYAGMTLGAFIMGDIALWKSMKAMLRERG